MRPSSHGRFSLLAGHPEAKTMIERGSAVRGLARCRTIAPMSMLADEADQVDLGLRWAPGFSALGPAFFTELQPPPLPDPYWVGGSAHVAAELGLDPAWLQSNDGLAAWPRGVHAAQPILPPWLPPTDLAATLAEWVGATSAPPCGSGSPPPR